MDKYESGFVRDLDVLHRDVVDAAVNYQTVARVHGRVSPEALASITGWREAQATFELSLADLDGRLACVSGGLDKALATVREMKEPLDRIADASK